MFFRCYFAEDYLTNFTFQVTHITTHYNYKPGDPERGYFGNKCYVECSRRGTCEYSTGTCKCFEGSWGTACENIANSGRHSFYSGADEPSFALADGNSTIIVEGN